MYKGLKKNQNYTWLICAAQNMKNISIKKSKTTESNQKLFDILKILLITLKLYLIFKIYSNKNP